MTKYQDTIKGAYFTVEDQKLIHRVVGMFDDNYVLVVAGLDEDGNPKKEGFATILALSWFEGRKLYHFIEDAERHAEDSAE